MESLMVRAGAGLAGAGALTAAHEGLRRVWSGAPRMDVLGERALRRHGHLYLRRRHMYWISLAGDVASNALYYAVVARRSWRRALAAGVLAGAGALVLPRYLGLGRPPHSLRLSNRLATVALYTLGALVTAALSRARG